MALKQIVRGVWSRLHPDSLLAVDKYIHERRKVQHISELAAAFKQSNAGLDLETVVERTIAPQAFKSTQKKTEILALLRHLEEIKPRYLCEIGSDRGGTVSLFCRVAAPDARILSIDLRHTPLQHAAFKQFVEAGQRLTCIDGDSHQQQTLEKARAWLAGNQLDFLFIDGDHTYDGVRQDYDMYSPLVRPGGIIAFHDITPINTAKYGPDNPFRTEGVARYWAEYRDTFPNRVEYIEDPAQDGYGIGIVRPE